VRGRKENISEKLIINIQREDIYVIAIPKILKLIKVFLSFIGNDLCAFRRIIAGGGISDISWKLKYLNFSNNFYWLKLDELRDIKLS